MARKPRAVAVGCPHHVTQRGNDRQQIFFHPRDREVYLDAVFRHATKYRLRIWGYCLMSNHVHFLAVPERANSLARVFGRTHSDYARYVNLLRDGSGHLWQARFYSCPLEDGAAWPVLAYLERNPVRAGLVAEAQDYRWSSAGIHCGENDPVGRLDLSPWRTQYTPERWLKILSTSVEEEALRERLRETTLAGLPFGSAGFVSSLEGTLGRVLRQRQAGRPRKMLMAAAPE